MDETVNMKRGLFNSMKEQQYYDYLKADNTYHILLKDTDSIGYAPEAGHNFIKQRIEAIGKEHIKKALCKVVYVSIPKEALADGNSRGIGFIKCNLARNTIVHGGRGTGYLGGFNMEEVTKQITTPVPAVTTRSGVPANGGLFAYADSTSNGGVWDSENNIQVNTLNKTAFGVIEQATYDLFQPQAQGVKANMFSTPSVLIDNPFGKVIDIDVMESNFQARIDMGEGAGEEFSIMLEVQLLPNFQENDRLNY